MEDMYPDQFTCPKCGAKGYASIYYNTCTACANYMRFGSVDPLDIQAVAKQSTLPSNRIKQFTMDLCNDIKKYCTHWKYKEDNNE